MKFRIMLVILLIAVSTGCVRIDIGDDLPTLGEELVKLERAKHLGAISDEEFKRLRGALLARW